MIVYFKLTDFYFFGGGTPSCVQDLLLVLYIEITPGGTQVIIWGAREQTQVSHLQDKPFTYCSSSLVPKCYFFKIF